MTSLFGHLCSGTKFAHDQEMGGLESQRAAKRCLKRPRTPSESQETLSSQVDGLQAAPLSAGVPEEHPASICQTRSNSASKRPHFSEVEEAESISKDGDLAVDMIYPKRSIGELRRSFERPLDVSKEQSSLSSRATEFEMAGLRPSNGKHNGVSSQSGPKDAGPQRTPFQQAAFTGWSLAGTQAEPIELSDDMSSEYDSQAQGNFLLEDLPEPEEKLVNSDSNSQPAPETQLTLSDAAFESQLSIMSPKSRVAQIQHRKQAYKSARDPNGAWAAEHSLVSSGADHGDEEVEL